MVWALQAQASLLLQLHCLLGLNMEYGKKTENQGNEKHPLDNLKNDKITGKREK